MICITNLQQCKANRVALMLGWVLGGIEKVSNKQNDRQFKTRISEN